MKYLFGLFLLISLPLLGQNLIPNPGFEVTQDTITRFIQEDTQFARIASPWIIPNNSTPDIITPGFYQHYVIPPPAHSGSNIIGIQASLDYTEYIGVHLLQPLVPKRTYQCEFWIRRSKCNAPKRDIDEPFNEYFGLLFTTSKLVREDHGMMPGNPQITGDSRQLITMKKWTKVSAYFTPESPFEFVYLGQFLKLGNDPPHLYSYYVVDDFNLEEISDFEAFDKDIKLSVGTIIPLANINFITGTTNFSSKAAHGILGELVDYLLANPELRIRINGHTDAKGRKGSNLSLSSQRADYVAKLLVEKGIVGGRIESKGFGEEVPIASNKTPEGRSKNRRVEFEIIE
jgi:outer membrane protein OmpA-like peptidoglycan-associated protein